MRKTIVAAAMLFVATGLYAQSWTCDSTPKCITDSPVGIGVGPSGAPVTKLHVSGAANNGSAKILIDRPANTADAALLLRSANDNTTQWAIGKFGTLASETLAFYYGSNTVPALSIDSSGRAVFGAASGTGLPFEVYGTAGAFGPYRRIMRLFDTSAMAAGVGAGIDLIGKSTSAGAYSEFANIKGVKANATDGDFGGNFVVSVTAANGTDVEILRVTSAGAHFVGAVTADNIQANYQDVAEWVPATEKLTPGTVVVVDANAQNGVAKSSRAYDTAVAGVVSANPGVILGVGGDSKAKIATTGRVKVHVDATKGPVRAGDLLVSSDRPGYAMKSEPVDVAGVKMHRPGTLIGKALEPLSGGEGDILVLLSLQ